MNPNLVWGALILGFVIFESIALVSRKSGDTLSERTQAWFHTHTRAGRITFGVAWLTFSGWYFWHILWGLT
jgi:hypothetical protein